MDRSQIRHGNWKILATGIAAFELEEQLADAGIDHFLRKPILLQDLENALGI